MVRPPHLLVALSPHGYGHGAMTAPVVEALRRRWPELRLTLQTRLSPDWLASRFDAPFALIDEIPDFGCVMAPGLTVDVAATAAAYAALHRDLAGVIATEAERLRRLGIDAVLANMPYVTVAAAAVAGIPAVAMSSLNWADIYRHYCGGRPGADRIEAEMVACYRRASAILRPQPAMPMASLGDSRVIGPVARRGRGSPAALRRRLGLGEATRVVLVAFGGVGLELDLSRWPRAPDCHWIMPDPPPPARPDMTHWAELGWNFVDLLASADAAMTKPGYGTFTEAAVAGTPLLYQPRADWPESAYLEGWLERHGRCLPCGLADLADGRWRARFERLLALPAPPQPEPTGAEQAAAVVAALVAGGVRPGP